MANTMAGKRLCGAVVASTGKTCANRALRNGRCRTHARVAKEAQRAADTAHAIAAYASSRHLFPA